MTDVRANARVQAFYREVNEGISAICEGWEVDLLEVLCECGRVGCSERVPVPHEQYERLRAEPTHFILRPGHDDPAVETVVSRTAEYLTVANFGEAASIARRTDPRGDSR